MTIALTWPNVYKMAGLVIVVLTFIMSTGAIVIDRQIRLLDGRLEDRWHNYQSDMQEIKRRLERLEERMRAGP